MTRIDTHVPVLLVMTAVGEDLQKDFEALNRVHDLFAL